MLILNDVYYFESISDFIDNVKNAQHIHGRQMASCDTGYERYSFTGTNNIDEAWELLEGGDYNLISKYQALDVDKLQHSTKNVQSLSVVGHTVNVPLFLNGVPQNMIRSDRRVFSDKIINILVNSHVNSEITKETVLKRTLDIFQKIMYLEETGYRINLYVSLGSVADKRDVEVHGFIKLKDDKERINVSKMLFPMCHPSMQRRLAFKFRECFGRKDVTSFGYGTQSLMTKERLEPHFKAMCRESFIYLRTMNYDETWAEYLHEK